jgi:hypothetical protein
MMPNSYRRLAAGCAAVATGLAAAYLMWSSDGLQRGLHETSTRVDADVSRMAVAGDLIPKALGNGDTGGIRDTLQAASQSPKKPRDRGAYTAAGAFELTHHNMQEVYAAEARTEPWATRREAAILDYTRTDILEADPAAKIDMDCRTSSCRIRIWSDDIRLVDYMGDFPFSCMARYGTADLTQTDGTRKYADFYILFGDATQDDDDYVANRDLTCPKYREIWKQFLQTTEH